MRTTAQESKGRRDEQKQEYTEMEQQHRQGLREVRAGAGADSRQRLSSSEPSPQSSAPSHTQSLEMQRWLLHSNCTG